MHSTDIINTNTLRGRDFAKFAQIVCNHTDTYTVPQYGDKGCDLATTYNAEDCIKAIRKYAARAGSNSREGQDRLDMLKIAHYAQLAYDKMGEDV